METNLGAVLVVDDDPACRTLVARILRGYGYRCEAVESAAAARQQLAASTWGLVVSDLVMEGETGMSLLDDIHARYPDVPVVMMSGVTDVATATAALSLGAYGYVTKPFDESQVLIAVENAFRRARLEAENAAYRSRLEHMVRARTKALRETVEQLELSEAQLRVASEETVSALARAIEGRDVETGQHIERMSRYAELLAGYYGLTTAHCELIRLASPMHDVGKIGVPDGILFKPGRLTAAEYDVIKQHPELGYVILAKSHRPLLVMAATIARTHHERWDGSGYPRGLSRDEIPLEGRIAAVADVFDAVMSPRCYKPASPLDQTLQIMTDGRGVHFDPDIVDLLLAHVDDLMAVRDEYQDA